MNNKFFKRQLVLYDFGIDVDNKPIYYYEYFIEKIDGIEKFTVPKHKSSIYYKKGEKVILECYDEDWFFIDSEIISSFCHTFDFNTDDTLSILRCCLEHYFKIKISHTFLDHFCEFNK